MAKVSVLFVSAVAVWTVVSANAWSKPAPSMPSLCAAKEEVVFSCERARKVISLCAAASPPGGKTQLRYIYGTKAKPELQITDPTAFTSGITPLSGGGIDYVRVKDGDFAYVVYTGQSQNWSQDGWIVEHKGEPVSHHVCKGGGAGPDVWGPVYAAKLPAAPDAVSFSAPDWTGAKPARAAHSSRQ